MSKLLNNLSLMQVIEFLEKCLAYEIGPSPRKNISEASFELNEISMELPEITLELQDISLEFNDIQLSPIAA